jgi:DNA-binding transcriptional ArsR family regulator
VRRPSVRGLLTNGNFDIFTDVQVSNLPVTDAAIGALASTFRLLGDPTRVRILMTLDDHDELCVHEIAERVGATETKVSQALRLLRTAGIVRNRRDGRHIHYRLDDDHVRTLLRVTAEHLDHGGVR